MSGVDGLDLLALERFFQEHVAGFLGHLTAELLAGGRSNLTYRLTEAQASTPSATRWPPSPPPAYAH